MVARHWDLGTSTAWTDVAARKIQVTLPEEGDRILAAAKSDARSRKEAEEIAKERPRGREPEPKNARAQRHRARPREAIRTATAEAFMVCL